MRRSLMLVLLGGAVLAAQTPARITASSFLAHVKLLASDEMGGRGNGTPGLEHAADYIARVFRDAGLRGGGTDGGFFQGFDAEVRVEPPATSTVVLGTPAGVQSFVLGRDYYPLSIRDRLTPPLGVRDVPVVFAGYGISAPGLGYDDFAGVEVRGAAVLVFTHEPQEGDEHSRFDGRSLTPGAAISAKAREARERGARLLDGGRGPVAPRGPHHARQLVDGSAERGDGDARRAAGARSPDACSAVVRPRANRRADRSHADAAVPEAGRHLGELRRVARAVHRAAPQRPRHPSWLRPRPCRRGHRRRRALRPRGHRRAVLRGARVHRTDSQRRRRQRIGHRRAPGDGANRRGGALALRPDDCVCVVCGRGAGPARDPSTTSRNRLSRSGERSP